jgi:hypothetical protein
VGRLKLGYLTLRFFASNSIALLNLPNELIALSFNDLPVIVGQSAHCSFAFPTNWFQLPLIWSVFIFDLRAVNPILSTASVGFEFPQGFQSLWRLSRPICEDHKARCFIPGVPRTPVPYDQAQHGFRRIAECHRRAGLGFHRSA